MVYAPHDVRLYLIRITTKVCQLLNDDHSGKFGDKITFFIPKPCYRVELDPTVTRQIFVDFMKI